MKVYKILNNAKDYAAAYLDELPKKEGFFPVKDLKATGEINRSTTIKIDRPGKSTGNPA